MPSPIRAVRRRPVRRPLPSVVGVVLGDQTLSGTPVLQRCEDDVDANYGTGAPPGTGLGTDTLIRSARPDHARPGSGAAHHRRQRRRHPHLRRRHPVIDDWFDRGFSQRTVDTVSFRRVSTTIVVTFYENGGDARVLTTIEEVAPPSCADPRSAVAGQMVQQPDPVGYAGHHPV